jgi:hypothetical protein
LAALFDLASLVDLDALLVLSFVLLIFAGLAPAWVCWPLEGPLENGAAVAGWLRATTPATANGQNLFGRIRETNGLFLVWRESPGCSTDCYCIDKIDESQKSRETGRQ